MLLRSLWIIYLFFVSRLSMLFLRVSQEYAVKTWIAEINLQNPEPRHLRVITEKNIYIIISEVNVPSDKSKKYVALDTMISDDDDLVRNTKYLDNGNRIVYWQSLYSYRLEMLKAMKNGSYEYDYGN